MNNAPLNTWAAAALLVTALFLIGGVSPGALNWGFHFLGFLPWYASLIFLALAVGWIIYVYRGDVERHIEALASLADQKPERSLLVTIAVFIGCAILFRVKASLLGDSYTIVNSFREYAEGNSPLAPWHEPLSMYFYFGATSFVAQLLSLRVEASFFAVDVIVGIGFVVSMFFIVRQLFASSAQRLLMLIVMMGLPSLLFFFGYIEIYGFSQLMLALFVLGSILVIRGKIPFAFLPPLYMIVTFSHYVNGLLILPTAYLAYREFQQGRTRDVLLGTFAAAGILFVILLLAHFDPERLIDISPISHQLSFTEDTSLLGSYTQAYSIFSLYHLSDILNYCLLMSPLLFIGCLVAAAKHRRALMQDPLGMWFLAALVPVLLYSLAANLEQGNADDWDVFASTFVFVNLFAGFIFLKFEKIRPLRVFALIAGCTLIFSMPWFTLNALSEPSIRRFQTLWDSRVVSHMGQYTMALRLTRYYDAQGDSLHQSDVWRDYRKLFPEDPRGYENEIDALDSYQPYDHVRKMHTYEEWMRIDPENAPLRRRHANECMDAGLALYASGDSHGAEQFYLLSIRSDSTNSHAYTNLGIIYAESGRLQAAIRQFFTSIRFDSVNSDAYYNLGIAFQDSGKEKESRAYLNTAARLGNEHAKKALQP